MEICRAVEALISGALIVWKRKEVRLSQTVEITKSVTYWESRKLDLIVQVVKRNE